MSPARGSRHRYPEGDYPDRRAAAARELRNQRSRRFARLPDHHAGRTLRPAIDRGGAAAVERPRLAHRADRLARQGVPPGRDAAARRCRGGVEHLPTPSPPGDRRAARCKCGPRRFGHHHQQRAPGGIGTQVSTAARAENFSLSVAADGTFVIRPNRAKLGPPSGEELDFG
jgi:hypothetical protein